MTNDLAALSEAATKGVATLLPGANSFMYDGRFIVGGDCVAFVHGDPAYAANGDIIDIEPSPDAAFLLALWNEYREGRLVHIPEGREGMRERVARAISRTVNPWDTDGDQWEGYCDEADAAIAAILGDAA